MAEKSRAAVFARPGVVEVREFALPEISDDDGLLRVDACGVCGTDSGYYNGSMAGANTGFKWDVIPPFILGHEPVGVIEKIGAKASKRWSVKAGDRVVVHAHYTCGRCAGCRNGQRCELPGRYGGTNVERPPSLYGAYADYMYLPPGINVAKISKKVPSRVAAQFNSIASGLNWAVEVPELQKGQSLVVLGPGQRGMACVLAGRYSGAGFIAVTGLPSDDYKLALAKKMGADLTINVEAGDPVAKVLDATRGGADVVVDTTPHSSQAFLQGIRMTKPSGVLVVAGVKGRDNYLKDVSVDMLCRPGIWIRGVVAVPPSTQKRAVALIEAGVFPLEQLSSHVFSIEQAEQALRTLDGKVKGERPMNVAIIPSERR